MGHCSRLAQIFAVFSVAFALAAGSAFATTVKTEHVTARLIPEAATVRPGQTLWVMLHLKLKDGWHTYWRNPGDSGQPPEINWTLPEGVKAGDIHWPFPEPLPYGPLLNYGYSHDAYHLVPIELASDWPAGKPVALHAKANWLVCAEICVPEDGTFDLSLPTGGAAAQSSLEAASLFRKARERLPVETDWTANASTAGDKVVLTIAGANLDTSRIRKAAFFPFEWGLIEPAAGQTLAADGTRLSLKMTAGQTPATDRLDGVLVLTEAEGDRTVERAFKISAPAAANPAAAAVPVAAAPATGGGGADTIGILTAVLFAVLGGLILNLMPCVFPVLSMKAMALIRYAEKDLRTVRLHGVAYALGVLSCFALLAGILIALKAGGHATGWGFQLQSPVFVAAMAYLFFLLGLNLIGVFEIGTSFMGAGGTLAARGGYSGSYFTGVLAAVVSTPCTAPFMGVALGYAVTQPTAISLAVFLALGAGFALPYLLLTFIPPLVRLLPRPGAWMERTRQFLSFPLFASVAWLLWVLAIQTGPDGVFAVTGGMVLIGFALWLWRSTGPGRHVVARATAATAAVVAVALVVGLTVALPETAATRVATDGRTADGPRYETFSAERLAALRAAGKPVFINMTAAWCITCQVNDRVALASETMAKQFEERGITYLKGDWTNGDPEITALLESFGRSGVPLYVLYRPGNAEPVVLPQLLTEAIVLDALQSLSATRQITAKPNGSPS